MHATSTIGTRRARLEAPDPVPVRVAREVADDRLAAREHRAQRLAVVRVDAEVLAAVVGALEVPT